jgi:hypothetical protein
MASGVRPAHQSAEVGWSNQSTRFRSSDDKNEVVILFDTDDTKKAKAFVASPDLKETMAKAGVTDSPTFYFLESAEPLRVMGTGWLELLGLHGVDGAK